MDHAIDALRVFYDIALDELKEDWNSGQYKKLSDCPSYSETKAYREAMNVLIKAYYLPEYVNDYLRPPLAEEIKFV